MTDSAITRALILSRLRILEDLELPAQERHKLIELSRQRDRVIDTLICEPRPKLSQDTYIELKKLESLEKQP